MGATWSCLAVKGGNRLSELAAVLGLEDTGKVVKDFEGKFVGAELPTGWTLIWADRTHEFGEPKRLAQASGLGEAIGAWINEIVMASEARGFSGGREVWSVLYDCNIDELEQVRVSGAPPVDVAPFREARLAEQAEEPGADCIFSVPSDVVEAICGFRVGEAVFTAKGLAPPVLKALQPARRGGFFARLFGR